MHPIFKFKKILGVLRPVIVGLLTMAQVPGRGPFDGALSAEAWFAETLAKDADDDSEKQQFASFIQYLRSHYKARDVLALKELSTTQLYVAAAATVGEQGKKGFIRLFLQHLGEPGKPHQPPAPEESEALSGTRKAKEACILFGREGKTGANSGEYNFPDAMFLPSKNIHVKTADQIELTDDIHSYLVNKADKYSENHRMNQATTKTIVQHVAVWVVNEFGVSPVSNCLQAL